MQMITSRVWSLDFRISVVPVFIYDYAVLNVERKSLSILKKSYIQVQNTQKIVLKVTI